MSEAAQEKRSYKNTLNLPKTAFAMKANLVQNEPASQKRWEKMGLYAQLREQRRDAEKFSFHDGPPLRQRLDPPGTPAQQGAQGPDRAQLLT